MFYTTAACFIQLKGSLVWQLFDEFLETQTYWGVYICAV